MKNVILILIIEINFMIYKYIFIVLNNLKNYILYKQLFSLTNI